MVEQHRLDTGRHQGATGPGAPTTPPPPAWPTSGCQFSAACWRASLIETAPSHSVPRSSLRAALAGLASESIFLHRTNYSYTKIVSQNCPLPRAPCMPAHNAPLPQALAWALASGPQPLWPEGWQPGGYTLVAVSLPPAASACFNKELFCGLASVYPCWP